MKRIFGKNIKIRKESNQSPNVIVSRKVTMCYENKSLINNVRIVCFSNERLNEIKGNQNRTF